MGNGSQKSTQKGCIAETFSILTVNKTGGFTHTNLWVYSPNLHKTGCGDTHLLTPALGGVQGDSQLSL